MIRPGVVPRRVVAVTSDTQLGWLPASLLDTLPTACIRTAGPGGVVVDRRNLHRALPGLEPTATVAVVGSRLGADPVGVAEVLAACGRGGIPVVDWQASADAVVFRVEAGLAAALERQLHDALLAPSGDAPE